jgi:hypothetical protein
MRKIFLALSPAILGLGLYACAGSPTAPSGMNDLSSGSAPARTESTVGNVRQFDNPVDADVVESGPDGENVSKNDKDKNDKDKNAKDANKESKDDKDKDKDKTKNENENKSENKNEGDKQSSDAGQSNGENNGQSNGQNGSQNGEQSSNNSGGSRLPTLGTNVASVMPGGNVVVTLTNGPNGANQWIALAPVSAPDTSYLLSIQVRPGVTARTWTVRMPTTAGPYEFRLFMNGNRGYALRGGARQDDGGVPKGPSSQNPRAATSRTVTVMSATTPPVIGNDPTPPPAPPVVVDEQPPPVVIEPTPPPPPVVEPPPPPPPPVVDPTPPPPSTDPAISVSSQIVTGGTSMSATLTNAPGDPFDWLAYAPVGSPDGDYWDWTYVAGGVTTYTWTFTVPAIPGTYEIRLILHGGTRVATSPPITVR